MNIIGKHSKPNAIISSSSSGLLPTRIYSKCKNPARTMIGHPFNPVYMCPGIEIVPGKKTKKNPPLRRVRGTNKKMSDFNLLENYIIVKTF